MFRWIVRKILGEAKREIKKSILQSDTTRTVAISSVSGITICRAICAALAEFGLIRPEMVEDTALILSAVVIPLISRLLAIIRDISSR